MLITRIERQKKNSSRASVYLDGAYAFGVSDEVLLRAALHAGKEVSPEKVKELQEADAAETAKQRAMRFLGIRPRTGKEITTYLFRKGYSEEIASMILEKLTALRLIDDLEFARMFCRDRLKLRPTGAQLLRRQLVQKGVPRPAIDLVLQELSPQASEAGTAADAAGRCWTKISRSRAATDPLVAKKKLLDHLMRRGFSYETSKVAIANLLRDHDE